MLHFFIRMTMVRLDRDQRALLAEKLPDAGNVAAGALVFGQFLSAGQFSPVALAGGTIIWLGFMIVALAFRRRVRSTTT